MLHSLRPDPGCSSHTSCILLELLFTGALSQCISLLSCLCTANTQTLNSSASPDLADALVIVLQGYFGDDCSQEAARLEYGVMQTRPERPFEYDYWQLPAGERALV